LNYLFNDLRTQTTKQVRMGVETSFSQLRSKFLFLYQVALFKEMYYTDARAASDQSTLVSTILGSPTHK